MYFLTTICTVKSSLCTSVTSYCCQVTSKNDKAQYWADPSKPYVFIPVSEMVIAFKISRFGKSLESTLSVPYDKSQGHPSALSKTNYAASRWELLNSCFAREKLLITRHSFLYIVRTCQVAFVTSTLFLRTRLHPRDETNGNLYISALYFGVIFPLHVCKICSTPNGNGLFRTLAAVARDIVISNTFGSAALLLILLLDQIKPWWVWASLLSPLQYAQRAICINEFTATRWKKISSIGNNTIGYNVLHARGLPSAEHWYWLRVGVLLLYAVIFNIIVTFSLSYLNPLSKEPTIIHDETQDSSSSTNGTPAAQGSSRNGMILPFEPLAMTFHNEMSAQGLPETRLQLLSNVTGVFSPGVLTALVGSSGAGKTTMMDVLSGGETGGYIVVVGDIKISGYPKEQKTFARILGYVEQNDIHSPQVTVEESLWFYSSLQLPKEISKAQRLEFVEEVMRLVELNTLRNSIVGLPGTSDLSTEQRKPAIVMRTVRNTVDTGRTVVCTIHQPGVDIFEAFDEGIDGILPIPDGYNPATWMLEVTSHSVEQRIGIDFADIYNNSAQYREVEGSITCLTVPPLEAKPCVLEKSTLQPSETSFYNGVRTDIWLSFLGHWDTTKGLFMVMGALYSACLFLGVNNASSVQPIASIERTIFYREKAAGMYAPTSYAAAQGLVELPYIVIVTPLIRIRPEYESEVSH
ncbi:ABC transporter G family member 31 [Hibiscus syriacus]|uniref:ABC transporter G family member 31 n=1 Tax=Hibiscus syriacus TaxID=106335 RepID=A0A6A2Z707_HIBSY|nr:ABC transporter G family member 31 [Hibiscus syriacus]